MSRWLKTILFLLGSAFLTHLIPFSSFFRNLDTMIHEFGHAVVTLLLSGHVMNMQLNADHSGVTYSSVTRAWALIPIGLAGYISASLFALLLFYLGSRGKQRLGLQLVTALAAITLVLFVHSGFGFFWLIGFIVLNVIVMLLGRSIRNFYYLLLAFLTLEESVFGPVTLVIYGMTSPRQAGDAANLARSTSVPAVVWALLFTIIALWCAKGALGYFFGGRRKRTPAPPSYYQ